MLFYSLYGIVCDMWYDSSNTLCGIWHQVKNQYKFRNGTMFHSLFKLCYWVESHIFAVKCDKHVGSRVRNCKMKYGKWGISNLSFLRSFLFFRYFHPNLTSTDVQLFLPSPQQVYQPTVHCFNQQICSFCCLVWYHTSCWPCSVASL